MSLLFCAVLLGLSLLATAVTATNGDYALPVVVDLGVLVAGLWALVAARQGRAEIVQRYRWVAVSLVALLVVDGIRYYWAFQRPELAAGLRCAGMVGWLEQLSCFYSLDFRQNFGMRQLSLHLCALVLSFGVAAICLEAQQRQVKLKLVLGILLVPSLLFMGYQLTGHYWGVTDTLAGSLWVAPRVPGFDRGLAVVSNQSWAWPLIAPLLAFALGCCLQGRWLVGAPLTVMATLGVLVCGQRGALLAVAMAFGLLALWMVFGLAWRWRASLWWRRGVLFGGLGLVVLLASIPWLPNSLNYYVRATLESMGITMWRSLPLSFSPARLEMWQAGWLAFLQKPWWGHGYASWFGAIDGLTARDWQLPTAHNLWIQMLVEKGLLFTLAVTAVFLRWIGSAWHRSSSSGRGALVVFVGVTLTVAAVQEVDHVNTVYYQFALIWGVLLAWPGSQERGQVVHRGQVLSQKVLWFSASLASLLLVVVMANISSAGYGFVPAMNVEGRMIRDFRPQGRLAVYGKRKRPKYAYFGIALNGGTTSLQLSSPLGEGLNFRHWPDEGRSYVVALAGARQWPRVYSVEAEFGGTQFHKQKAFTLIYPPVYSDMAILRGQGLHAWEPGQKPHHGERWCSRHCRLLLRGSEQRCAGDLLPALQLSIPQHEDYLAAALTVRFRAIDAPEANRQMATAEVFTQDMDEFESTRTYRLHQGHHQRLLNVPLENSSDTWGYVIEIETPFAFVPAQLGMAGDKRELSSRLRGFRCIPQQALAVADKRSLAY